MECYEFNISTLYNTDIMRGGNFYNEKLDITQRASNLEVG